MIFVHTQGQIELPAPWSWSTRNTQCRLLPLIDDVVRLIR